MARLPAIIAGIALVLAPLSAGAQLGNPPRLNYEQQQRDYEQSVQDYKAALARYEADKAAYDRRYGAGSYDRGHSAPLSPNAPPFPPKPAPAASPTGKAGGAVKPAPAKPASAKPIAQAPAPQPAPVAAPTQPTPQGRFEPNGGPPYVAASCMRRSEATRGALAAAMASALGAGAASASSKSEGAVLGALIDGTLGENLTSEISARRYAPECDGEGFYFASDQTFPYRESVASRRLKNGDQDERDYVADGCRLAVAPISGRKGVEYHYARVCPDQRRRYRFTG